MGPSWHPSGNFVARFSKVSYPQEWALNDHIALYCSICDTCVMHVRQRSSNSTATETCHPHANFAMLCWLLQGELQIELLLITLHQCHAHICLIISLPSRIPVWWPRSVINVVKKNHKKLNIVHFGWVKAMAPVTLCYQTKMALWWGMIWRGVDFFRTYTVGLHGLKLYHSFRFDYIARYKK